MHSASADQRHAGVGDQNLPARPEGLHRPEGVVACAPEPGLDGMVRGEFRMLSAVVPGKIGERLRLRGGREMGSVKLDEQMRRRRQAQAGMSGGRTHLPFVQQLDPRRREAGLDRRDRSLAGRSDVRETADPGKYGFGPSPEPQSQPYDDAENALGAEKETREVEAGRALPRAPFCPDERSVRGDRIQRNHVLAHRSVAHGHGSRSPRRRHSAQRRVSARIHRKEEPGVTQVNVERPVSHAGLHRAVEIPLTHRQHPVHSRQVKRYSAERRVDLSLHPGSRAEGDHRATMFRADGQHAAHVIRAFREDDGVGKLRGMPCERVGMLTPDRLGA